MKHIVVGTAGHIDHGKSALVGALTGIDPDRLKEEKARGITIDLGFAHCAIDDLNVAFVDVPGHERFVKNMLAGVGGIDCVLLVVAADESVMPQTREHFDICRLLQVPAGLIALTKVDLVDPETLELVRLEVRELVTGSFLERAPIVPVSSTTGEGLPALRAALAELGRRVARQSEGGATRLPVDRVFSMKGFGTVVTGTLVAGRIAVDEELVALPAARRVKVRGVQVHGTKQARASAGQRVAVNLGGVEVAEIARGAVLTAPATFKPTRRVDAVVELLPSARPLRHGARVRFHHGTSEVLGRIALSGPAPAPRGGPQGAGEAAVYAELAPGASAHVRLRFEAPVVLTRGDRFILRAYSPPATIAGGRVLDPDPPRVGIRTPAARARFERLDAAESRSKAAAAGDPAVALMIEESGAAGLPPAALTNRAGVAPEAVPSTIEGLRQAGLAEVAGDVLVAPGVIDGLKRRLVALIGDHHRAHPLEEGMPREEARERLFARAAPAVFARVIDELAAAGTIVARDRLTLAGRRLALSDDEARAREAIERAFREAGLTPPDPAGLAAATGVPSAVVDRVIKLLVRQKVIVRLDTLLFHEEALQRLKTDVAGLKQTTEGQARIDVGSFKERYGITRKFAIPLLEYLDRERVTRRIGDARVVI